MGEFLYLRQIYGCDLEFGFGDHSCAVILTQDKIVPASEYPRTWELRDLPLGRETIAPANAHQVALSVTSLMHNQSNSELPTVGAHLHAARARDMSSQAPWFRGHPEVTPMSQVGKLSLRGNRHLFLSLMPT